MTFRCEHCSTKAVQFIRAKHTKADRQNLLARCGDHLFGEGEAGFMTLPGDLIHVYEISEEEFVIRMVLDDRVLND